MVDRELQTILNSGGINTIYLGGTASTDKVQKKSDLTGGNVTVDDTGLGITANNMQEAFAIMAEVGLLVLSGTSRPTQALTTSPAKIQAFDTKQIETGVGCSGDVALHRASATLDGVYKLRFESFVSYSGSADITWQMYKNGTPFGNSVTIPGQGTKVFPIVLISSTSLTAGDYLELYGTGSTSVSLDISQANGTLEKTLF